MKKYLISITLFVATMTAFMGSASALPVAAVGTTYSVYLAGNESGNPFLGQTVFDSFTAFADRSGMTLALSESETVLSGTSSRISLSLSADGDLFPIFGEAAILAIGVEGDGLDLLRQVTLDDARISFFDNNNVLQRISENLAGQVQQGSPWDGFFPAPANAFGIGDVGGLGITRIIFDFTVSDISREVPEPGSLMLGGIALVGLVAVRRRQIKPCRNA